MNYTYKPQTIGGLLLASLALLLAACGFLNDIPPIPPQPTATIPEPPALPSGRIPTTTPADSALSSSALTDTETMTNTDPTTPTAVLPAPVYYLAEGQIWRLERDGTTARQMTSETTRIVTFDPRPAHNQLAYTVYDDPESTLGMALVWLDIASGERRVLARTDIEFSNLHWSPNGSLLAYYAGNGTQADEVGGTYLIDVTAAEPQPALLQINDPLDPYNPPGEGYRYYAPLAWSPAGDRLVLEMGFGLALKDVTTPDAPPEVLTYPDNALAGNKYPPADTPLPCCDVSWQPNGQGLFVASDGDMWISTITPGLWLVNMQRTSTLLMLTGEQDGIFYPVVAPYQPPGGDLAFFSTATSEQPTPGGGAPPLLMSRLPEQETTGGERMQMDDTMNENERPARQSGPLEYIRRDEYAMDEVLWAADGSGALVRAFEETSIETYLLWLPAERSPAQRLPVDGGTLRWGEE